MSKSLHFPPSKRVPGLHIYCARCDTLVSDRCKLADLPLEKCKNGDKHKFKGIVYVEGNTRKTKTFGRDYDEAVEGVARLRNQAKEEITSVAVLEKALVRTPTTESIVSVVLPKEVPQQIGTREESRSYALLPLMAKYVGFLHGDETVPIFKRKKRSQGHIADVERAFLRFATAAKEAGYNLNTLRVDGITDEIVGAFYTYLTEKRALGNAGYNRMVSVMTSFLTHLIENEGYPIINPFVQIIRKPRKRSIKTIKPGQFTKLLEAIEKPELGIRTLGSGRRKNYWRPFMRNALELALYTGRRRTETVLMKWDDIVYEDTVAQYIVVPDHKFNNAKNLPKEDWKYNYAPITAELAALLHRMGEETNRHSDRYILAPDEPMSRETMARLISKCFAHYAEHIGLDLSFGSLRRTNFSSLAAAIGIENAQTISGHSGLEVMRKHYVSKEVLAKAVQDFNVFDKDKQGERKRKSAALKKEKKGHSLER